jgi:hypothetical protein
MTARPAHDGFHHPPRPGRRDCWAARWAWWRELWWDVVFPFFLLGVAVGFVAWLALGDLIR